MERYNNVRSTKLPDGDMVGVLGPLAAPSPFTYVYVNLGTIALDKRFGLDKMPLQEEDNRRTLLDRCTMPGTLGNWHVEGTILYFTTLAKNGGMFIGIREEELVKNVSGLYLEETLNQMTSGGPYLVRKEVDGHKVIFPQNLEVWPF
jgi:hypothetical protein